MTNLDRYNDNWLIEKKYCFGFVKYSRTMADGFNYRLQLFGLPIASRRYEHDRPTIQCLFLKYRLNVAHRTKRLIKDIKNEKLKHYDHVFVLFNNLGETRLFLESLRDLVPDNSLFVYTKRYHGELLKMILPNKETLFYPEFFSVHFQRDASPVLNSNPTVHLIGCIDYFKEYETSMQTMDTAHIPHFYRNYLEKVGGAIGYPVKPKTVKPLKVLELERKRALEKIEILIGRSKFVIVCNETFSNINLKPAFYRELCRQLYAQGYKVLFNSTGINSSNCLGIASSMSIQELVEIASYAEFVIGIRSGILDVLASNAKAIVALYTPFRKRPGFDELSAEKVLAAFTLSKVDFENKPKIREIIVDDDTPAKEIITRILQGESIRGQH